MNNYYFLSLEKGSVIDSGTRGSAARFVNHSCNPNCQMQKWYVGSVPRIGLFAARDIAAGEELLYDYNFVWFDGAEPQTCLCGSDNCRGIIGQRANDRPKTSPSVESDRQPEKKKPPRIIITVSSQKRRGPGRPPKNREAETAPPRKRGPGRPPKIHPGRPKALPTPPKSIVVQVTRPKHTIVLPSMKRESTKRGPGRPPKQRPGISPRRGPGRPPKSVTKRAVPSVRLEKKSRRTMLQATASQKQKTSRAIPAPAPSVPVRRGPGRPRKVHPVTPVAEPPPSKASPKRRKTVKRQTQRIAAQRVTAARHTRSRGALALTELPSTPPVRVKKGSRNYIPTGRPRGRPPRSSPKIVAQASPTRHEGRNSSSQIPAPSPDPLVAAQSAEEKPPAVKRGPGRPKGSKTRPIIEPTTLPLEEMDSGRLRRSRRLTEEHERLVESPERVSRRSTFVKEAATPAKGSGLGTALKTASDETGQERRSKVKTTSALVSEAGTHLHSHRVKGRELRERQRELRQRSLTIDRTTGAASPRHPRREELGAQENRLISSQQIRGEEPWPKNSGITSNQEQVRSEEQISKDSHTVSRHDHVGRGVGRPPKKKRRVGRRAEPRVAIENPGIAEEHDVETIGNFDYHPITRQATARASTPRSDGVRRYEFPMSDVPRPDAPIAESDDFRVIEYQYTPPPAVPVRKRPKATKNNLMVSNLFIPENFGASPQRSDGLLNLVRASEIAEQNDALAANNVQTREVDSRTPSQLPQEAPNQEFHKHPQQPNSQIPSNKFTGPTNNQVPTLQPPSQQFETLPIPVRPFPQQPYPVPVSQPLFQNPQPVPQPIGNQQSAQNHKLPENRHFQLPQSVNQLSQMSPVPQSPLGQAPMSVVPMGRTPMGRLSIGQALIREEAGQSPMEQTPMGPIGPPPMAQVQTPQVLGPPARNYSPSPYMPGPLQSLPAPPPMGYQGYPVGPGTPDAMAVQSHFPPVPATSAQFTPMRQTTFVDQYPSFSVEQLNESSQQSASSGSRLKSFYNYFSGPIQVAEPENPRPPPSNSFPPQIRIPIVVPGVTPLSTVQPTPPGTDTRPRPDQMMIMENPGESISQKRTQSVTKRRTKTAKKTSSVPSERVLAFPSPETTDHANRINELQQKQQEKAANRVDWRSIVGIGGVISPPAEPDRVDPSAAPCSTVTIDSSAQWHPSSPSTPIVGKTESRPILIE